MKEPTPFLMLSMMSSHEKAALVGDVGEKRASHVGRCGQQMGRLGREPLSWSLIGMLDSGTGQTCWYTRSLAGRDTSHWTGRLSP